MPLAYMVTYTSDICTKQYLEKVGQSGNTLQHSSAITGVI